MNPLEKIFQIWTHLTDKLKCCSSWQKELKKQQQNYMKIPKLTYFKKNTHTQKK